MPCCGRRRPGKVANDPAGRVQQDLYLVEIEGMSVVVFELDIGAAKTFHGPVTHIRYRFGGRRKVGRVDKRDLRTGDPKNPGLLEMRRGKKSAFREREPQQSSE